MKRDRDEDNNEKIKNDDEFGFQKNDKNEKFIWKKKMDLMEENDDENNNVDQKKEIISSADLVEEMERSKTRRAEKEAQVLELQELKELKQRQKENELLGDWDSQEIEFNVKQSRRASILRLFNKRENIIDKLSLPQLIELQIDFGAEIGPDGKPVATLGNLRKFPLISSPLLDLESFLSSLQNQVISSSSSNSSNSNNMMTSLKDLLRDIKVRLNSEQEASSFNVQVSCNVEFWNSLASLLEYQILLVTPGNVISKQHPSVFKEVQDSFINESVEKLLNEKISIEETLKTQQNNGGGDEIEFWQACLIECIYALGKARIDEYVKSVNKKLENYIKNAPPPTAEEEMYENMAPIDNTTDNSTFFRFQRNQGWKKRETNRIDALNNIATSTSNSSNSNAIEVDNSPGAVAWFKKESDRGFEQNEDALVRYDGGATIRTTSGNENNNNNQKILPRYLTRVRAGYEWNKFNKAHFDTKNPPPKTVQGYSFTIFYGELIDVTKTPKFVLEPADDPEFIIIKFKAGPPYADISFRIINKEWAIGKDLGYKCIFENGVLQLQFKFRRIHYRR